MFVFQKIWRALFSLNTRFEILPFALLPTNLYDIRQKHYLKRNDKLWFFAARVK